MKITVNRTSLPEGNLEFKITVSEPHSTCFGPLELQMMKLLDICKDDINRITPEENKLKNDVFGLVHTAKDRLFSRVIDNLKFSIENELRPMFRPICQEIYNWIKDHQNGDLMNWMIEFDPQRTKYYFHNDTQYENIVRGPSEIPEDYLFDEDEDDYEDDEDDEVE